MVGANVAKYALAVIDMVEAEKHLEEARKLGPRQVKMASMTWDAKANNLYREAKRIANETHLSRRSRRD